MKLKIFIIAAVFALFWGSVSAQKWSGKKENTVPVGHGVMTWKNSNARFEGEMRNGKYYFGTFTYKSGAKYTGPFLDRKRHGFGQMWFVSGAIYIGYWLNDLRHGAGTHIATDGSIISGVFYNDELITGHSVSKDGKFE
ncbi:hypothetical protein [uncultured Alistipes sp.]|uniref:hypothetical protein n=1 Tax=uncultured Alistipes sp. TaxID=538949 RepID=UPI0025FA2307|nr:hypothetical protein [uncultured Alistipes sp.]